MIPDSRVKAEREKTIEAFNWYSQHDYSISVFSYESKESWKMHRRIHAWYAMLAKIARLVKEVRELRKENAELKERVGQLESALWNSPYPEHSHD